MRFDRLTDDAKEALNCARQAAGRLGHAYIGPEHVVLGLFDESLAFGNEVNQLLGADPDRIRSAVETIVKRGRDSEVTGSLPFTERARQALVFSVGP